MARHWIQEEDNMLKQLMEQYGRQWSVIATHIPDRNATQVAARWEKCLNPALTKGPFSTTEDELIANFVAEHGLKEWSKVTSVLPNRTAKQCRERWFNNLDPTVEKGPWTPRDDELIFQHYQIHGPKWSVISREIPGRSDNAVKNRWNASISKRVSVDASGAAVLGPSKTRKYGRTMVRPPPIVTPVSAIDVAQVPIQLSPRDIVGTDELVDLDFFGFGDFYQQDAMKSDHSFGDKMLCSPTEVCFEFM